MKPPHVKPTFFSDRVRSMLDLTNTEIAAEIGCSIKHVQNIRRLSKGPTRPSRPGAWTDERIEALKKDWAAGYSASQIAARLGGFENCDDGGRNSVIGKVRRLGLPFRASNGNHSARNRQRTGEFSVRGAARCSYAYKLDVTVLGDKRPVMKRDPAPLSPAAQVIRAIKRDGIEIPPPQETDIPRVALVDLDKNHCRWVCKDDGHALYDPKFCGLKPEPGLPYCKGHVLRAFGPPNPSRPGQSFQLRKLEVA